ncbi:hypothetical protein [Rhodocista pekingensis]|uniref:Uncharacterized protein n=1 Tax=Rhodocista pekingensis TaxID=201185 RepID=A0ABW2KV03_9PROT
MRSGNAVLALLLTVLAGVTAIPAQAQLFGGGRCGGGGWLGGLLGGGCPIIESRPGIVEGMVAVQQAEIVLQTAHMLSQIEHMIAMRRLSPLDTAGAIAARLRTARGMLDRVDLVPWSVAGVEAQYAGLYPDVLPETWTAADLTAHRREQARLTKAASRASKLASADAVTAAAEYPARIGAVMAALKACTGQACAADMATQAGLLSVEVTSQMLLVQAAHQRAVEARLDEERAALERARLHDLINWRDIDRYGGR